MEPAPPPSPVPPGPSGGRRRFSIWEFLVGLVAFWALDVVFSLAVVFSGGSEAPAAVLVAVLALLTAGTALLAIKKKSQGFAAGLVTGYVVLTLLTHGVCTFLPWGRT